MSMPGRPAERAVRDFLDALLLNWIIAGTDAHATKYSLLLAGGDVRLAPFYDIASALPYDGMPIQKLRLAMKLGGHYELKPTPPTWRRLSTDVGLAEDDIVRRAQTLVERAPDAFAAAARADDVAALDGALPARLLDVVTARAKECARDLRRPGG